MAVVKLRATFLAINPHKQIILTKSTRILTMTMTIYGHPMSTCTRKVLTTLAEKKAKAKLVSIDLGTTNRTPDYLARQPFGQIPVLEHDDFRLYESRAICRYLDQVLPGVSLTPSNPQQRATMEQWISIETSNFTPHAMTLIYQLVFHPTRGLATDAQKVEEGKAKLVPTLDILEKHLGSRAYLAGEQFTLADIGYLPYIEYLFAGNVGHLISSRYHLNAWWERSCHRSSWKQATGKEPMTVYET